MKYFISIIALLTIFSSNIFAQQINAKDFEAFQLKALNKIKTFGVFVWDIELAKKNQNWKEVFSTKEVTNYVTDKLKSSGLNPVSFDEAGDLPGGPSLDILTTTKINKDTDKIAVNITIRFVQDVQLARNTKILHYSASTWIKSSLFIVDVESGAAVFFEELDKLLEMFAKDYKKAN